MEGLGNLDPEALFLSSEQKTGNEWELFKENVRPLKRGRNVSLLNQSLKSHTNNQLKKSLIETRRRLIQAIDEYKGDDPLQPWLDCIKWVQEAFPTGGDSSALVIIYEQCVRTFWHSDRYKEDLRYLKVWLEYADNCADGRVIYIFLDENRIGQSHSLYFISYALFMESKNKYKSADGIFNFGISRNAQPREKLEAAYRKFLARIMKRPTISNEDEDPSEIMLPVRCFGTVLASNENRILPSESSDFSNKRLKTNRSQNPPFSIYKETSSDVNCVHETDASHTHMTAWDVLGTQAQRNKENNAPLSKWKKFKIPQRQGSGSGATNLIDIFIDDECSKPLKTGTDVEKTFSLELQKLDGCDVRKELELLKKNPLRNFR